MDETLLKVLREAKVRHESEGFIILGIFGSRARGDYRPDSDVDILYRLENGFYERYPGWEAAAKLDNLRTELSALFGLEVDLADANHLHAVGKKYILPETVYVS